jgi:hypothetical protein
MMKDSRANSEFHVGNTKLALFEGTPQGTRETAGFHLVAFRVGAAAFRSFLDRLPHLGLTNHRGQAVTPDLVADHAAAYSIYFCDPFGHRLELTTYEYEEAKGLFGRKSDP